MDAMNADNAVLENNETENTENETQEEELTTYIGRAPLAGLTDDQFVEILNGSKSLDDAGEKIQAIFDEFVASGGNLRLYGTLRQYVSGRAARLRRDGIDVKRFPRGAGTTRTEEGLINKIAKTRATLALLEAQLAQMTGEGKRIVPSSETLNEARELMAEQM